MYSAWLLMCTGGLPIFPAISWRRELLARFLIFLMQMRTCGIIVRAFEAILWNIASLIHEWQAKSHNVIRFFFFLFTFYFFFCKKKKKKERETILLNVTLQYYIITFITDIDTYATYFVNYTCNSRLLLIIL